MKAIDFSCYDIVDDTEFESHSIYRLTPTLYEEAISMGKEFEPVRLTLDMLSKIGFNIRKFKGVDGYILVLDDLTLAPVFDETSQEIYAYAVVNSIRYDAEHDSAFIDLCEFIKPIEYVHQLQSIMRLCGLNDIANNLKV